MHTLAPEDLFVVTDLLLEERFGCAPVPKVPHVFDWHRSTEADFSLGFCRPLPNWVL